MTCDDKGRLSITSMHILCQTSKEPIEPIDINKDDGRYSKYFTHLFHKLVHLGLIEKRQTRLFLNEQEATRWSKFSLEDKAIALLRHPKHTLLSYPFDPLFLSEKNLKDAQKSIIHAIDLGWVELETLLDRVTVPLHSQKGVKLKRIGIRYRYDIPEYSPWERALIKASFEESLFESGFVDKGFCDDKVYIRVTKFGKAVFGE